MLDVLASGYPSFDWIFPVSHSPKVGETALIESVPESDNMLFGGCGANIAVALSIMGFNTGVAMIVGNDDLGSLYRTRLDQYDVDHLNVIRVIGEKTSRSYLFAAPDGEYQNFFYPGAADTWEGKLILENIDKVRYGLVTVGPFEHNRQFVEQMVAANVPIIWQMKPDVKAYPQESVKFFLEASETVFMNHIEADFVCRAMGVDDASKLLNSKTQTIMVTQGESGVTLYTPEGSTTIDAIKAEVVDTTGAGDGFAAGFLAGKFKGFNNETAVRIGIVMASFVLEKIGCQTNLPDWYQMQKRYEEHFGTL